MSNTNTKIFSEAIAEAKSIRETAMANAKLALEEAFAPRMQEMMSSRLEALAEENEEMEEAFEKSNGEMPGDQVDEISLEELLAELEALEEGEAEEVYEEGQIDENQIDEIELAEEAEDDDSVGEITVDDLKDIIRDVVAGLMGGESEEEAGEEEGPEEEEAGEEEENSEEEELNLEEILAELESLNENEEEVYEGELDEMIEQTPELWQVLVGIGSIAGAGLGYAKWHAKAIAGELGDKMKKLAQGFDKTGSAAAGTVSGTATGVEESEELEEAMSTISTLRSELNEVNLLNAKLLYVNKLFKSKNLTEAQKVKVINAFDRAETVKETKNIFETLQESLNVIPTKNSIKESLSYASKAVGVADRKPIVENNDFVARMQKLAGII